MTAPLELTARSVVEDQDVAGRADSRPAHAPFRGALVCYRCDDRGTVTVEWTYWASRGQARQAEVELTPCGPLCIGVHSVVRLDAMPHRRRTEDSGQGRLRPVTAESSCPADGATT